MATMNGAGEGIRTPPVALLREGSQTTRVRLATMHGAGEGIRTLDPNLGKVVLYP